MPDNLPQHPDFGYFTERPPIIVDRDDGDVSAPVSYPFRQDFEADVIAELTDELSALTAQLGKLTRERDAAIREYEACHDIMDKVRSIVADCLGDEIEFGLTVEAPRKAVAEIERQRAQLEAARLAYRSTYKSLVLDNPWRTAAVTDGLREIGDKLGVE